MTRLTHLASAVLLALAPVLSLRGVAGDKGDKGKEDALIAAMKFVKVPKGTFWMGWDSVKKTSKQVEIKKDFELAAYTVTQEQWQAVMGNNPSQYSRKGFMKDVVKDIADADLKRFPIESVNWNEVQEFLKKLNEREKGKGWVYRLPSEAEWEYACRGAATSKEACSFDFYLTKPTNDLFSKDANFDGDRPAGKAEKGPYLVRPTKVGSYKPNQLGLYDMHGNVSQWCDDLYDLGRAFRGGAWSEEGEIQRAAERRSGRPTVGGSGLGFRLARVSADGK